jgi:pSer/pThr/pTyr-binding forkhead associated (FHA) protein
MFKLVIQDDEGKTTVVPLIRDEITIGRKEGNTIRLTERNVSRRHARILRANGEVQIEDLGSYNGIRVNNARIAERVNLRVSDQVQIGDYKLYLKAEGVEQVDDARTMPIERIDTTAGGAPTDIIAAVAPAPTTPITIPPTPAVGTPTVPAAPQIVGNPNRTLVAMADTDPSTGRPLARPELIAAAIPQATGFGKLVVLSSNFAGKEFDLSRPQMIIGRTDENDLVVNHRSISRNHAKVVREPDTGRYTISDLQSSNGVRVNGNDYSKVELRRGDVVDLGHVRLRFVEPGEDFVFSRDAVITDVPETGSKKGLLVAIVLGIVVLGGVLVFFLTRGPGDDTKGNGTGTGGNVVTPTPDGPVVAVATPDAAIEDPPLTPDATAAVATDDIKKIQTRCSEAQAAKKWTDLEECGHALVKAGDADGKAYVTRASTEARAEVAAREITVALKTSPQPDFKTAETLLDSIKQDSVYRKEAETAVNKVRNPLLQNTINDLKRASKDCARYNNIARQAELSFGRSFIDDAKTRAGRCENVAVVTPPPAGCNPACSSDERCDVNKCVKKPVVTPPTNLCNDATAVQDIETKAEQAYSNGSFAQSLGFYEQVLKCRPALTQKAYLAACRARAFPRAKALFGLLNKENLAQICMKEGFDPRK